VTELRNLYEPSAGNGCCNFLRSVRWSELIDVSDENERS
jgi:hypothetical protein